MYVGCSTGGTILVIKNNEIINNFNGCGGASDYVLSIIFDESGYMATSCYSYDKLYLYNKNLNYTGN